MEKELQQAADAGFEYRGQTVFKSTFGGEEVVCILERDKDAGAERSQVRAAGHIEDVDAAEGTAGRRTRRLSDPGHDGRQDRAWAATSWSPSSGGRGRTPHRLKRGATFDRTGKPSDLPRGSLARAERRRAVSDGVDRPSHWSPRRDARTAAIDVRADCRARRTQRALRRASGSAPWSRRASSTVDATEHSLPSAAGARCVPDACRRRGQLRGVHAASSLLGNVEDEIVECFKHGGGVPHEKYPRFHGVMAEDSGLSVMSSLESHILPLVPRLAERLAAGIRTLDVGCGSGRILNRLAELFPNSRFVGMDLSAQATAQRRADASAKGLRNVDFVTRRSQRLRPDRRARGVRLHHHVRRGPRSEPAAERAEGDSPIACAGRRLFDAGNQGLEPRLSQHRSSDRHVPLRRVVHALHDRVAGAGRRRTRGDVGEEKTRDYLTRARLFDRSRSTNWRTTFRTTGMSSGQVTPSRRSFWRQRRRSRSTRSSWYFR